MHTLPQVHFSLLHLVNLVATRWTSEFILYYCHTQKECNNFIIRLKFVLEKKGEGERKRMGKKRKEPESPVPELRGW